MALKKFPKYLQLYSKDCGPSCIKIICEHYGKFVPIEKISEEAQTNREGSNMFGLIKASEELGFKTLATKTSFKALSDHAPLPFIAHWNQSHFCVVYRITKSKVYVSDPAFGLLTYTHKEFLKGWASGDQTDGVVLLLETTSKFYDQESVEFRKYGFSAIFSYLTKYRSFIRQLVFGLAASSLIQLAFPFITKGIVDVGIRNKDVGFVWMLLVAQLFLFVGKSAVEITRAWILLHLSTRINISLVSEFFIKLMKLPIKFFDLRLTGDILQRINDHDRIEKLITTSSLSTIFSIFNLLLFLGVLLYFNFIIFLIFLIGSTLYIVWFMIFMKRREEYDYKRFAIVSSNQSTIIEMVNGMQELKLNNSERRKRLLWENIQSKLFQLSMKSLRLEQFQTLGSSFINEIKNILITAISAVLVINGNMTLGGLLAISYILGQLNGPLSQLLNFSLALQDARISLNRIGETHSRADETPRIKQPLIINSNEPSTIEFRNVSFGYEGSQSLVLNNVSFKLKGNEMTAIVGASGSGKSTILKLLLRFYTPSSGEILVNETPLSNFDISSWRDYCGVVMQEGYIFNDTIAGNICLSTDLYEQSRMRDAIVVANIREFVDDLPNGLDTKIGNEGLGISVGQKQRILIARAIYKAPSLILFDEATSSLDSLNENQIVNNLNQFLENRTSVVVAHRLSTVRNANQIIVIGEGEILERGTHEELVNNRGDYFKLVQNQLDLNQQ
jgi:ATP-binding cassette subfamily B protein